MAGRTAFGAGFLAFFFVLLVGGAEDVFATWLDTSVQQVVWVLRISCIIVPPIVAAATYLICKELQAEHGSGKRKTPNIVTRTADGEYVAVPAPRYGEDVGHELDPTPVPTYIEPEPEEVRESGVRTVER